MNEIVNSLGNEVHSVTHIGIIPDRRESAEFIFCMIGCIAYVSKIIVRKQQILQRIPVRTHRMRADQLIIFSVQFLHPYLCVFKLVFLVIFRMRRPPSAVEFDVVMINIIQLVFLKRL